MTPSPADYDEDSDEYQEQLDEFEEALANCCGHFEADGVFWCGAVGSKDCDFECPFNRDVGLTAEQIDERDDIEYAEGEAPLSREDVEIMKEEQDENPNAPIG